MQLDDTPGVDSDAPRANASRSERRRLESTKRKLLAAIVVPPLAIALAVAAITSPSRDAANAPTPADIGAAGKPVTYLVMTVRSDDLSRQADTLMLLSLGGGAKPYTLMIPPSALTEIPGYGFDSIGKSLSFGRIPLADVTVENLLGVRVDHTEVVEDKVLARLIDRIGGVTVTVPANLLESDGAGRLVPLFGAGDQKLSGARAVKYLTFQGRDETELSRLARAQQVWEAIFARFGGTASAELERIVTALGGGLDGDDSPARFGRYMAAFASLSPGERTFDVVPVVPVGSGADHGAFRVEETELGLIVARYLSGSLSSAAGERPRLQLLNGNGTPESGIAAAQRLIPAGFRLVDSGNARSFSFEQTKIIVYVDDAQVMAAAQEARRLLRVGVIELSRTPNTSVDVTVVIGKDFAAS